MKIDLPFPFNMGTAAFVIVDMQNDFVRSNAPLGVPDALQTIEPINADPDLRGRNSPAGIPPRLQNNRLTGLRVLLRSPASRGYS